MLIVLTSGYPFGGEPFLISENKYTPKDTIYISLEPKEETENKNFVGKAYKVQAKKERIKAALYALTGIFDIEFWREIKTIKKTKYFFLKKMYRMICFYSGSKKCYKKVISIIKDNKYDTSNLTLYSYWMSYHAFVAAMIKKKYPSVKCITRCHGYDVYEYRSDIEYLPFRNMIFRNMDKICPISKDAAQYINTRYGHDVYSKVIVSHLGTLDYIIDSNSIYNTNDDYFRIISCSSLIALKRVDQIIQALNEEYSKKIKWDHYGDGPLKKELEDLATIKLKNVDFCFHGNVDNTKLMEYYEMNQYDLFINVSSSEGIPVSIMEAISFGVPVIATDVGGTSEIVHNNKNGFLIPKDFTTDELKEIIHKYINSSKEMKKTFRGNARSIWERNFSAKTNYESFFQNIIERL